VRRFLNQKRCIKKNENYNKMKILKIGLPAGSLKDATFELFKKAGFNITMNGRNYKPQIDDDEIDCTLIRAQEIPKYVENGVLDAGLTGEDWINETSSDVKEIEELLYAKQRLKKVKLVIAVANDSNIKSVKDLEGKRIATEYVNITKRYLEKNNVKALVEFSWGATEVKVPELAEAIAELTETGASLKANNLKIIDTIMESSTKFIANKNSIKDPWKYDKINKIALLLKGALLAEEKVGLKMNIDDHQLKDVLEILPALKHPTISPLGKDGWLALDSIVDEAVVRDIIPKLKELGAEGIVEYPVNIVGKESRRSRFGRAILRSKERTLFLIFREV